MVKTIKESWLEQRPNPTDPSELGYILVNYVVEIDGGQMVKEIKVDTDIDEIFPGPASSNFALALEMAKAAEGIN